MKMWDPGIRGGLAQGRESNACWLQCIRPFLQGTAMLRGRLLCRRWILRRWSLLPHLWGWLLWH